MNKQLGGTYKWEMETKNEHLELQNEIWKKTHKTFSRKSKSIHYNFIL